MSFDPFIPRKFGTVAHCISALFKQAGGIQRVMVRLGIKQSVAYGYTEDGTDADISFRRVAALTDPDCTAAAEYLASLSGGVFLPLDCEQKGGNALSLSADATRANAEAVASVIDAMRDGRMTADERAKARPLIDVALCDLARLRGLLAEDRLDNAGTG